MVVGKPDVRHVPVDAVPVMETGEESESKRVVEEDPAKDE